MSTESDLIEQLEAFGATLRQHVGETITPAPTTDSSNGAIRRPGDHRASRSGSPLPSRWLWIAASAAVVIGVVAVAIVRSGDDTTPSVQTLPDTVPVVSTTIADITTTVPDSVAPTDPDVAVDPDAVIDTGRLRFPEPLPADVVAFIDDPSLPPPELLPAPTDAGPQGENSVRIIFMDDTRFVAKAGVVEIASGDIEPSGDPVDIGVDGARYLDDDRGSIAIPLNQGWRLVAPEDFFRFNGGGPFIDDADLRSLAESVGQQPIGQLDSIEGVYTYDGTVDGARVGVFGDAMSTTTQGSVDQPGAGSDAVRSMLVRFDEPLTALDLYALIHAFTLGPIEGGEVGDITFTPTPSVVMELVSPTDLLIVTGPDDASELIDQVSFVPVDEVS